MHYSGALYIIHYISCVINLRVSGVLISQSQLCFTSDTDNTSAGDIEDFNKLGREKGRW